MNADATAHPGAAREPTELGQYRLGEIVRGPLAVGTAYLATDIRGDSSGVVTVCSDGDAERFLADVERLREAHHRALPQVLDAGVDEGIPWVATSLIDGLPLAELLPASTEELAPMLAIRVIGEITDGLERLHQVGLVHGQISPEAILVRRHPIERPVLTMLPVGTGELPVDAVSPYCAPELRGGGPPTEAGDHYALSMVLLEALTGRHEVGDGLPSGLEPTFAAALADDPKNRTPSQTMLSEAARALLGGPPPRRAAPPQPAATRPTGGLLGALGLSVARPGSKPTPKAPAAPADANGRGTGAVSSPRAEARPPSPGGHRMRPVSAPSEARGDSRSRPALAIGLGLVLVALFGVAGLLLGRQSGDASRAATSRAQAGDISLEVPSDWKRGGQAPRALIGTEATSATGRGGRLIAGTVAGAGPLFPGQAARRLIANAQASGTVRLGRLDAYRFDGERATLFLSPTSAGLVAVSCTGGRAFLPACQRAATTLRLDGDMRPVALAGLGGYAARADRVVDSLAATRRRDRSALRQARTRDSQKQIARQLAQADRVAARQLGRGVPDGVRPQAVGLRNALNRAAVAYGGLARAGTPAGYSTSSRRVRAAERQVDRALARL